MTLFQFRWLRRFIKRHTSPIPYNTAEVWKRRLSYAYAILAWNAFGFVIYNIYIGKADWAKYHNLKSDEELRLTPAQQWTKTLGIKDATVYRVSGLKYSKYEIHNELPQEESSSTEDRS